MRKGEPRRMGFIWSIKTVGRCEPTTHRLVRKVVLPPPPHWVECRSGPTAAKTQVSVRKRFGPGKKALSATDVTMRCRPKPTEARRFIVGPKRLKRSDALSVSN